MKIPLLRTWLLCKQEQIGVGVHLTQMVNISSNLQNDWEFGGNVPEHRLSEDDTVPIELKIHWW